MLRDLIPLGSFHMHLSRLTVNHYIASKLGLKENSMGDLGTLVVLVGENGSGKTRLLEALNWLLHRTRHIGYSRLQKMRSNRAKEEKFLRKLDWDGDPYTRVGAASDIDEFDAVLSPFQGFELNIEDDEDIDAALSKYCALSDILRNAFIPRKEHFARLTLGVPRGDDLTGTLLIDAPLSYIDDICVRKSIDLTAETMGNHSAHNTISADYENLKNLLSEIAGMQLGILEGHARIDNRRVDSTTFSDGQMALLRLAVLIHSQALGDAPVPIILDEPEQHLHPSRLVQLIDALRIHLPRAQLWIATHSLALTAHVASIEPRAVWFGSDGYFERAGLTQEKVVNGLLGGPMGAEQISDFCTRADQFAACSFSADCLFPPATVNYKSGDPQIQQIRDFIVGESKYPAVIVDIGAGQGRLLDGLVQSLGTEFSKSVSYYAIEPDETTRNICAQRVNQHFEDGSNRVFASVHDYLKNVDIKADVAVMANVLHEIEIQYWLEVLRDTHELLEDTGSLLIVEDTRLPRGELAHANSFLILETEALCSLFSQKSDSDSVQCIAASRGGARLQATAFRKPLLSELTTASLNSALELQRSMTINSIRELRKSNDKPNYRLGHEHAYHTQLLANLTLALEDLSVLALKDTGASCVATEA